MNKHGTFQWNELMTRDAETAKAFYEKTLGWTFSSMPMENSTYWIANVDDQPAGGIFTMDSPDFEGIPEHWFCYIAVDDIDARLKLAEGAGATILRAPFDVPGVGRIAILKEPGGAAVGWYTPSNMG